MRVFTLISVGLWYVWKKKKIDKITHYLLQRRCGCSVYGGSAVFLKIVLRQVQNCRRKGENGIADDTSAGPPTRRTVFRGYAAADIGRSTHVFTSARFVFFFFKPERCAKPSFCYKKRINYLFVTACLQRPPQTPPDRAHLFCSVANPGILRRGDCSGIFFLLPPLNNTVKFFNVFRINSASRIVPSRRKMSELNTGCASIYPFNTLHWYESVFE